MNQNLLCLKHLTFISLTVLTLVLLVETTLNSPEMNNPYLSTSCARFSVLGWVLISR